MSGCEYSPINIKRPMVTDGPLSYSTIQKEESVGQEGPLTYEFMHDPSHPGSPKDWFYSRWFEEGWFDPEVAEDFSFKTLEPISIAEENSNFSYERL